MPSHIDPDTYSVYDYVTGQRVEGTPTRELVMESLAAGDTGAVCGTYDPEAAEWSYLREDEADAARRRGDHVRTVYVMGA